MTPPERAAALARSNRETAEDFGEYIIRLVLLFGGTKSTAHKCAAAWFEAVERGEFGE